ncbi:MAG: thiamine pyrophosphate-dependent dehydrogenase E1 component subunit alpha [Candidatus Krumholzibacteriia bacterium]
MRHEFDIWRCIADTARVVIRSEAFDPPEYVSWQATPAALDEWQQTLDASRSRRRITGALTPTDHVKLFAGLLRFRLMDTFLKRWVKQGVISKAWLGTGEEAVTVGNVHALRRGRDGDVVGPMIRNAGAYREMGMPMAAVFKSYLGTHDQLCKGRDLHIGDLECGVISPISMVAALVPVCAGAALAFKQRREDRVALTWVGDGSTRTGDFHEGMSLAAALGLPLVVVIQNNQVALGTRVEVHTRAPLDKLHVAYGVKGYACDGNNVLDTYAATVQAVTDCRKGRGPVLLAANTFRMGGHATHDEAEARELVPRALFQYWGERDPVGLYETHLARSEMALEEGVESLGLHLDALPRPRAERNRAVLDQVARAADAEVEAAAAEALESRESAMPDGSDVDHGTYAQPCE